jgi:hypothetical protein
MTGVLFAEDAAAVAKLRDEPFASAELFSVDGVQTYPTNNAQQPPTGASQGQA